MDSGMNCLIESFYRSIRQDDPLPIPYREILLTAKIMDAIFDQVRVGRPKGPSESQAHPVALAMSTQGSPTGA
jgi:hypothetical protein